jgi:hypothetical protein
MMSMAVVIPNAQPSATLANLELLSEGNPSRRVRAAYSADRCTQAVPSQTPSYFRPVTLSATIE